MLNNKIINEDLIMKNKILILTLLSAITLMGCTNVKTSSNTSTTTTTTEETTTTTESTTTGSETSEVPAHVVQIYFNNITTIKAGADLKDPAQQEPFMNLFNGDYPNLLESYTSEKVFVQTSQSIKDLPEINFLTIGASKAKGTLTLNFAKDLKEVTIRARAYYKHFAYDGYDGWSNDDNPTLTVNFDGKENTMNLPSDPMQYKESEIVVQTFKSDTTSNTLTLSSQDGEHKRVFIESMTFAY